MDYRYIFMLLMAIIIIESECQLDEMARMFRNDNSKKVYCGKELSKELSLVCKGNYNTLTKKTDIYDNVYWDARYSSDVQQHDIDYPFRSKSKASSLISNFRRRRRRGVYNECCEKSCSHAELSSYCGDDRNRKRRR